MTYPLEPAKSANQVVDELAEENAQLKEALAEADASNVARWKGLAQAEHHFQQIQGGIAVLQRSRITEENLAGFLHELSAHVTAGLDACRNTKAGK